MARPGELLFFSNIRGAMGIERREYRRTCRRPVPVHGVLMSALQRYGLAEGFTRYQFVSRWSEIVGSEIARRAQPECLRNGTLVVRVCIQRGLRS